MLKTCQMCGKEFHTVHSPQLYCSRACRGLADRKRVEVTCAECGKHFEVCPARLAKGGAIYCSRTCFGLGHSRYMTEHPSNPRVEKAICACEQCGKEFAVLPSMLKRTDIRQGRFCSRECHHAHKRTVTGEAHPLYKPATHVCEWCGKEYRTKAVFVRNGMTRFCSRQCHGAWSAKYSNRKRTIPEITIRDLLIDMGLTFESEVPLGFYVCDFLLTPHNVVIECDGDYWHSLPNVIRRDRMKNAWLRGNGYVVLRLPESLIRSNLEECEYRIRSALPTPLGL